MQLKALDVLEIVIRNYIDHGTHDILAILFDTRQQRLEPSNRALTMRVQKGQHLTGGMFGPQQTCRNETLALMHSKHFCVDGQCGYIVIQRFLQEF